MECQVFKEGQLVASGSSGKSVELEVEGLPKMTCYNIPVVKLERTFVFEHLQGRPLTSIFHKAGMRVSNGADEPKDVEPVYLVHARSDALRGRVTVSAVALVHLEGEVDLKELASKTPEIYKKMSALI